MFKLDAVEKEQIELPVSGGLTSMHSTVKETCQGQGCNAPTDKPDGKLTSYKLCTEYIKKSSFKTIFRFYDYYKG